MQTTKFFLERYSTTARDQQVLVPTNALLGMVLGTLASVAKQCNL